jgi:hypothetical protein
MKPDKFEQAYEKALGAGDNPNTGDLPYRIGADPQTPGPVFCVSCWELSDEELANVMKTKRVFVAVMASPEHRSQPPIVVHGFNPFLDYGDQSYKLLAQRYSEQMIDEIIDKVNNDAKDKQGAADQPSDTSV